MSGEYVPEVELTDEMRAAGVAALLEHWIALKEGDEDYGFVVTSVFLAMRRAEISPSSAPQTIP